jgi:hypothetical protein
VHITVTTEAAATQSPPGWRAFARLSASVAVAAAAFFAANFVAARPPFEHRAGAPSETDRVLRALPFDAPLPYDITLERAGRGPDLPYAIEYTSALPPEALGAQVADHLAGAPKWALTQDTDLRAEFQTTFSRVDSTGLLTHFAVATMMREGEGTRFTFEFVPIAELGAD